MEPLYPQNILERHYPILREQREKEERERSEETNQTRAEEYSFSDPPEVVLYANEPLSGGSVGRTLNTVA